MKKKKWYVAMATALLLAAGCSDDLDNGKNNTGAEEDGEKVYMTVNVSTVSQGTLTKADTTPSNPNQGGAGWGEDGNGSLGELSGSKEGMVYDVNIFLVPTDEESLGDGNQLELLNTDNGSSIQIAGQGYYSNLEGIDASLGGTEPGHGDGKVTMKVTMKNPLTQDKSNYQVFAVINAGGRLTGISTLADLRDRVAANDRALWTPASNMAEYHHFVMSTHKMISGAIPSNGSSIVELSAANMDETNPAQTTVFVERLAARIDLAYSSNLDLTNIPGTSPVKNKGTFTLKRYKVVNQWKGESYLFKQVSPTVQYNYGANAVLPADGTNDPVRYLGDEKWIWRNNDTGAGSYNYVLDPKIREKKLPEGESSSWDQFKDSYVNYFNPSNSTDLNNLDKMVSMPTSGLSYTQEVSGDSRTYYPVVYTKENTLDLNSQVHGYTTGVIFESEFTPSNDFKVSSYENGEIKSVNLPNGDKTFLSAAHYNSNGSVSRLVYKDVKSVAARAFNLENDKKNLLKGFMDGWDDITADVNAVKKAVQDMSSQNGLESAFKEYLDGILAGKATLDEDLKQKLTYAAFRRQASHLPSNITPVSQFCSEQIGNLYQYYNVSLYKSGRSYHKFWIRHNDNGNDGLMGVMEFCIVRNNVYQLYVKGIRGLGDPLPYTPGKDDPGTPDESDDVTIDVTIYVKDWVKRTNKDIIL